MTKRKIVIGKQMGQGNVSTKNFSKLFVTSIPTIKSTYVARFGLKSVKIKADGLTIHAAPLLINHE